MAQNAKDEPNIVPKSFDVIAPGKTAPATSSKPIIITNRPMVRDPMSPGPISNTAGASQPASRLSKPVDSTLLMPSSNEQRQDPSVARLPGRRTMKTITTLGDHQTQGTTVPVAPQDKVEPTSGPATTVPEAAVANAESTDDVAVQSKTEMETEAESTSSDETISTDVPLADNERLRAEKENEIRLAEQEKIITSKQYFLPIEDAAKSRGNNRALLWLLIVLVGTLVWLDLVLEAGVVHISGVHALTHFFKS